MKVKLCDQYLNGETMRSREQEQYIKGDLLNLIPNLNRGPLTTCIKQFLNIHLPNTVRIKCELLQVELSERSKRQVTEAE